MWKQLVTPQVVNDNAGMCLRFTQSVFGAPVKYRSAWDAWNATQFKHSTDEPLPDVSVIVWMSHWGTYGDPPSYENWGHVITWFPSENKFLSSPGSGYGHQWFDSIRAVELYFNAGYVGWSEDINGLRVAEFTATPLLGDENMYAVAQYADGWAGFWNMATGQTGHIDTVEEWQRITPGMKVYQFADAAAFDAWKRKYGNVLPLNVDADAIAKAVVAELGNTEVNVDAIAQAVADKIDCSCDCGCGIPVPEDDGTTKADILEAIETNYPEDK
jgi:hypothetical protein